MELKTNATHYVFKYEAPNGRAYIGYSSDYSRIGHPPTKPMWGADFTQAIAEFGAEAFHYRTLEDNLTLEEAIESKRYYIEALGTLAPDGYNLRTSGLHSTACKKTCERMSLATRKTWQVIIPTGQLVRVKNMKKFCAERGLVYSSVVSAFANNRSFKGFHQATSTGAR